MPGSYLKLIFLLIHVHFCLLETSHFSNSLLLCPIIMTCCWNLPRLFSSVYKHYFSHLKEIIYPFLCSSLQQNNSRIGSPAVPILLFFPSLKSLPVRPLLSTYCKTVLLQITSDFHCTESQALVLSLLDISKFGKMITFFFF